MSTNNDEPSSFDEFARDVEPRLREALSAAVGSDVGRDAAAEAIEYAWRHWPKVSAMDNAAGYLYVLGLNRGRRLLRRRPVTLLVAHEERIPWVESGLLDALEQLSEQQRTTVMLLFCFEWTYSEVAETLGVSRSTVQKHADRGLAHLRSRMGVTV